MFLVGGPALSGTTLLTLMLNQGDIICLDEPDFHNPAQGHRGIPVLRSRFPGISFPEMSGRELTYPEAVELILHCEAAIGSHQLGIKTCDRIFIGYFDVCRLRGFPVIAIFRDIRDALVTPLPDWLTEAALNDAYRLVWQHREQFNLWLRYEDLVADPGREIAGIAAVLGKPLEVKRSWAPSDVPHMMLKLDRHQRLKEGRLSTSRVGIWRSSGKKFSAETHETARLMGY
jgi:hypothetical protein